MAFSVPRMPSRRLLSLVLLSVCLVFALFPHTGRSEKLENGLEIDITKPGDCSVKSKSGDTIAVHYKGMLMGGTVFDESYKRGEPIEITLGAGQVIAGWDLGLANVCLGEERTLIIPPALAYGARKMHTIPPQSTLKFETKMMKINDKKVADEPQKPQKPDESKDKPDGDKGKDDSKGKEKPGAENGQCKLLGPFALVVQGGLGVLALLSLVFKRWRERPRRPVKVWFFDVSKQVVGAIMVHFVNLLMSELPGTGSLNNKTQVDGGTGGQGPNPCSFYLINIAVDTTIGIPILVLLLKVLHSLASMTPLARPPESIKSGHYGQPPHTQWWFKQSFIYFIGLLLMKLCVFLIFKLIPWIALVGDWALRWTEGNEALQITFVMFIFPLIMNAIQYYIIDSFIKDPAGGSGEHEPLYNEDTDLSDDEADDESRRPLAHPDAFDEDDEPESAHRTRDEHKRH